MKLLFEIVLSIFLHPLAMILCWINVLTRADLSTLQKVVWLIVTTVWGIGPIIYVLAGDGTFF